MYAKLALMLAMSGALAACATPRQQCLDTAQRDLVVVDSLIAETRGNLEPAMSAMTKAGCGPSAAFAPKRAVSPVNGPWPSIWALSGASSTS